MGISSEIMGFFMGFLLSLKTANPIGPMEFESKIIMSVQLKSTILVETLWTDSCSHLSGFIYLCLSYCVVLSVDGCKILHHQG